MKKFFYLVALLMLSLTFVVSCSEDKKDEPEVPEIPAPPPAPTTADSLQGTWVSCEGKIAGTIPTASGPYSFTTTNLIVLKRDTLKFISDNITHIWAPITPSASFPHKILTGTFGITNGILTNTYISKKEWTLPPPGIPQTTTIADVHAYKISFSTDLLHAPYSKDTLTLIMTGSSIITNNKYNPAMGLAGNTNTSAVHEPVISLKFKRLTSTF